MKDNDSFDCPSNYFSVYLYIYDIVKPKMKPKLIKSQKTDRGYNIKINKLTDISCELSGNI